MKKYISISLIALLTLTGCEGFLTEDPILSQSNELTLGTLNGLDKATAGVYAPLASTDWYGQQFITLNEMKTSNGKKWIGSDYDSGRMNDYYNLNYSDNTTSSLWGTAYYVISAANNVMDNLEGKGDETVLNNLKAECLFLRALAHFDLVRTYAQPYCYTADASHLGVPVVLHTDPKATPKRDAVKDVYAQIIDDLLEAEKCIDPAYVREGVKDSKSVVSIYAIQALLARAYLYSEQWQNAATYAKKVIDSKKYSLWTAAQMKNAACFCEEVGGAEVIFEVYGSKSNSYDGYHDGLSPMCGPNGYGDAGCSADLIGLYEASDVRSTLFLEKDGITWTAKYAGKGVSTPDVTNTIVLRLSEMYLIIAEAVVNGASGFDGVGALKAIAEARGATVQNCTKEGVALERQKELAWEAHLWFDLGRTKKDMTRTDFVGSAEMKDIAWGTKYWAMPIPMRETGVNPNLVQNDGWSK